jgi:hypothetical protein
MHETNSRHTRVKGAEGDRGRTGADLRTLVATVKKIGECHPVRVPRDPRAQLERVIECSGASWNALTAVATVGRSTSRPTSARS